MGKILFENVKLLTIPLLQKAIKNVSGKNQTILLSKFLKNKSEQFVEGNFHATSAEK